VWVQKSIFRCLDTKRFRRKISRSALRFLILKTLIFKLLSYGQPWDQVDKSGLPYVSLINTLRFYKPEDIMLYLSSYRQRGRLRLKCDGTHAETRFRLSAKRTSPFKSAGTSVQSTAGSRGVRISGSNAGYTMFRGSVKGTGYPLNSPVSPSLPLPCVTMCHHISTGLYILRNVTLVLLTNKYIFHFLYSVQ